MPVTILLSVVGVLVLLAIAIALAYSSRQQQMRNEVRRAMIEKFGSAQDLGAFLQTEGGRRFMSDLSTGGASGSVLSSVQKGIILILLGMGIWGGAVLPDETARQTAIALGTVVLFAGVGFLVSAVVTHRLSKSLGLTDRRPEN